MLAKHFSDREITIRLISLAQIQQWPTLVRNTWRLQEHFLYIITHSR